MQKIKKTQTKSLKKVQIKSPKSTKLKSKKKSNSRLYYKTMSKQDKIDRGIGRIYVLGIHMEIRKDLMKPSTI